LLASFLDELTEPLSVKLLQFALRCGGNEFTVRPIGQSAPLPMEQFQTFILGQRRKEVPTDGSKRKFESIPIWTFNEESAAAILRLSVGGIHHSRFDWVIYKLAYISTIARPGMGRTYMSLVQNQWEELLRLGFRFSLLTPDGKVYKKEYTEIDLPENRQKKLVAKYPGLVDGPSRLPITVDDLFKNPYGVMSFPPGSAYGYPRINPEAANNTYILSWWTAAHDELLTRQIERDGWKWWPSIGAIAKLTDSDVFTKWQIDDPHCLRGNWADVLAAFARARAFQKGLLNNVEWPSETKMCELCGEKFLPSLHYPSLTEVAPLITCRYCSACIRESFGETNRHATKDECLSYVRRLSELLGRVPNSDFATDWIDLASLDEKNASDVLRLLRSKPPLERVKDHFGSWLAALVEAGVLEDGTRKMPRGTQCLARDGHVCLPAYRARDSPRERSQVSGRRISM
jgi:hypothetical protein